MVFGPPAAGDRRQTAVPGGGEGGEEIRLVRLRAQQEPGRTGNGPGTGGTRTPRTPTQAGIHGGMRRGMGQDRSHGEPPPPRSRGGLLGGGGGERCCCPPGGSRSTPIPGGWIPPRGGGGDMRSQCQQHGASCPAGCNSAAPSPARHPPAPQNHPPPPPFTSSPFASQPFCDGAHKKAAPGISPLRFIPEEDKTVWLCGCKRTRSPPYCDGTHKEEAVQGAQLSAQP